PVGKIEVFEPFLRRPQARPPAEWFEQLDPILEPHEINHVHLAASTRKVHPPSMSWERYPRPPHHSPYRVDGVREVILRHEKMHRTADLSGSFPARTRI